MRPSIPNAFYRDPAVLDAERRALWHAAWQFVGLSRDLASPGDFITADLAGRSVLVQNFAGELRAFENVCLHRSCRIRSAARGNGPLRCPYHGWTYDERGAAVGIPHRRSFAPETLEAVSRERLAPWRVATCGELVFVSGDPNGPDLRAFLADLFDPLELMASSLGPRIDVNEMVVEANWKVYLENALEDLHVGFVHDSTFATLSPGIGTYRYEGSHSTWDAPLAEETHPALRRVNSCFEGRPFAIDGYRHVFVFPNFAMSTNRGISFNIMAHNAVSPTVTHFAHSLFLARHDGVKPAQQAIIDMMAASLVASTRAVFAEDAEVSASVQRGLASSDRESVYGSRETRIVRFHEAYMAALESARHGSLEAVEDR